MSAPAAVGPCLDRLEQATAHLLAALHSGAELTPEHASRLRLLVGALPTFAVPAADRDADVLTA